MIFDFNPLVVYTFVTHEQKRPNFNNFATKRTQCINNAFHNLSLPAYINFDTKVPNRTNMRYFCIRVYKQMHEVSSWISLSGPLWITTEFQSEGKVKGHRFSSIQYKIRTTTHEQQMNRVIVHPSQAHRRR